MSARTQYGFCDYLEELVSLLSCAVHFWDLVDLKAFKLPCSSQTRSVSLRLAISLNETILKVVKVGVWNCLEHSDWNFKVVSWIKLLTLKGLTLAFPEIWTQDLFIWMQNQIVNIFCVSFFYPFGRFSMMKVMVFFLQTKRTKQTWRSSLPTHRTPASQTCVCFWRTLLSSRRATRMATGKLPPSAQWTCYRE